MRHIWYDSGKILPKTVKTAEQVMKEAGLNWSVEKKQIQIVDGSIVPNKVAIVRSDTGSILGIVNFTYKCIQNSQVFSFLDQFAKSGDIIYHAAGCVGCGEKVWVLAKLYEDIELSKQEIIEKFILFTNAHDGRGAIRAYFIPVRSNTESLLNISFGKRVDQGIQMRHVGKVEQRMNESKKVFDLAKDFYQTFEDSIKRMYSSSLKQRKVDLFFANCFENYSLDSTRTQNTLNKIKQFYEKEIKMFPNSKDTAWAWLNSVINYIDFERPSKGKDSLDKNSNHFESLFWGSGLLFKQKAWNTISSLIKL